MLATTSLGATWTSCSPDFGINGVLDRFGQVAPKVLFTADGYFYDGKADRFAGAGARRARATAVGRARRRDPVPVRRRRTSPGLPNAVALRRLRPARRRRRSSSACRSITPLYVLYSSGTTGVPKCIVHGAGGTLLQHLKEHLLHTDLKPGDRLFFFTTCGWMMWNWLASALAVGCDAGALRRLALRVPDRRRALGPGRATSASRVFGTSRQVSRRAARRTALAPGAAFDLGALRTLLSTGSPLAPEQFDYVLPRDQGRRAARLDLRRHRHHLLLLRSATRCCRCIAASCSAAGSA